MSKFLDVKILDERATVPTIAHQGDLAYDLYALEDTVLYLFKPTKIRTGIAVSAWKTNQVKKYSDRGIIGEYIKNEEIKLGLLVRERSSMAMKGLITIGGVIDSTYSGELFVNMMNTNEEQDFLQKMYVGYQIKAGDKIAQAVPVEVLTGEIRIVDQLQESSRGDKGYGSSGK